MNSGWSDARADSTVYPGFIRPKICTHWLRLSAISSQPGFISGFIWIGTRICGELEGSRPVNPAADTLGEGKSSQEQPDLRPYFSPVPSTVSKCGASGSR